jgi:hypothetical protein
MQIKRSKLNLQGPSCPEPSAGVTDGPECARLAAEASAPAYE